MELTQQPSMKPVVSDGAWAVSGLKTSSFGVALRPMGRWPRPDERLAGGAAGSERRGCLPPRERESRMSSSATGDASLVREDLVSDEQDQEGREPP
jgi:hypothetical protein